MTPEPAPPTPPTPPAPADETWAASPPPIPAARRAAVAAALEALRRARRIVLTTHVNADGDGAGCEAALAAWLAREQHTVTIVNPTPFPKPYEYLLEDPGQVADPGSPRATEAIETADLVVILDTSEPRRIGRIAKALGNRPALVIDHHPPPESGIPGTLLQDPAACATGELVYDLLASAGPEAEPWPAAAIEGIYVAIVTDTGSFRFANTTPRAHLVAADLMRRGVDPEAVYRRIFATVSLRRLHLLRAALERLEVDPELPITWISIPREIAEQLGVTAEDLEGIVEHARSVEGTEVAILFREVDGSTKVSFRSSGRVDVNALARAFGGGGHTKAAGALVSAPLEAARAAVLEAARAAVRALETQTPNG